MALDPFTQNDSGPLGQIAKELQELQEHRQLLDRIVRDIDRHEALLGAIAVDWQQSDDDELLDVVVDGDLL